MCHFKQIIQDQRFAGSIFDIFDDDGSGAMDFAEYVHASSVHDSSSPKDKVRLCLRKNNCLACWKLLFGTIRNFHSMVSSWPGCSLLLTPMREAA